MLSPASSAGAAVTSFRLLGCRRREGTAADRSRRRQAASGWHVHRGDRASSRGWLQERQVSRAGENGRGLHAVADALSHRRAGKVTPSNPNPHVMFYGPGLTDADIGGVRGSLVFMNKVGPDGMIIVPVGSKERETILSDSRPLIDRVESAIGYKPATK